MAATLELDLLTAVSEGKVRCQHSEQASGPGFSMWVIDGRRATAYEAALLTGMSRKAWIVTASEHGHMAVGVHGRTQLQLQ